jgi:hypothetical protein
LPEEGRTPWRSRGDEDAILGAGQPDGAALGAAVTNAVLFAVYWLFVAAPVS